MTDESIGLLTLVAQNTWMFSITSIFLVFIGWKVTYNNSARLATRSESKSLVDALAKIINDISDLSIDFWINKSQSAKTNNEPYNGIKINSRVKVDKSVSRLFQMTVFAKMAQAYKYVGLLEERNITFDKAWISYFPEKATLDSEVAYKMLLASRADRVQEILELSKNTINDLYGAFQESHPPSRSINIMKFMKQTNHKIEKWHDSIK